VRLAAADIAYDQRFAENENCLGSCFVVVGPHGVVRAEC